MTRIRVASAAVPVVATALFALVLLAPSGWAAPTADPSGPPHTTTAPSARYSSSPPTTESTQPPSSPPPTTESTQPPSSPPTTSESTQPPSSPPPTTESTQPPSSAAIAGTSVTNPLPPVATAPAATVAGRALAETGARARPLLLAGLAILGLGSLLIGFGRRRGTYQG